MSEIPTEGEETGHTFRGTVKRGPHDEPKKVLIRVLRDTEHDILLIEQNFDHATAVTEFDIVTNYRVEARRSVTAYPDYVLKAVVAAGYETIDEPDWL